MVSRLSSIFQRILIAVVAGILITASSCVTVKDHQPGKPFVYKTNIKLTQQFSKDTADELISGLKNQLDDSVRARTKSVLWWEVLKTPPVYYNENADKSIIFMRALLNSLGYFNDSIYYDTTVNVVNKSAKRGDQYRTTVTFYVRPGRQVRLDSISYDLKDSNLQAITMANMKETYLKKGEAFAKGPISAERDRLVELYRANGYLKFNREELIGLWDTVDVELLRPAIDPLEQIEQLQKLAARRDSLTANLEMRLRPGYDSSKLVKFYVGNVDIYPNYQPDYTSDSINLKADTVTVAQNMRVIQYGKKFKPHIFPIYIYLKHDSIYSQRRHQRTINRLNELQTWKIVNVKPIARPGTDTVDFAIELTPAIKYVFNANFEASQNQTAVAGNLFGIGVNVGVQNRNLWRAANQSGFNFRYGVELGNKFIQTQQASLSYNIYFPRPIPNFKWISENLRDNIRTVLSFNAANTERRELYNLTTINASWGYEFTRNRPRLNRSVGINVRIPNIEYSYLLKRDSLDTLIAKNPSLRNIFNDGLIASLISGTYTRRTGSANRPTVVTFGFEEAGLFAGLIPSRFLDSQLYRFIKVSAEYTTQFKWRKSSVVLRAFGGLGWELDITKNPDKKATLPFFKQYFAGGPNSMRAWRLRRLGPGSVVKDFGDNPDRFGDIQLEFNAEYRWAMGNLGIMKIESALFTDIGNIWFLKKSASTDPREVFNVGRLYEDLAVGVGAGLRLDFSYFLVRLDYAFKAKDPSPDQVNAAGQNQWFYNFNPLKGQLQIGINYPFKL
jgi:outer membrane protein insertion porin family